MYSNNIGLGIRDEMYPAGISEGHPGYTYKEATNMKAQQEKLMQEAKCTKDVRVEIIPVGDNRFCVRNTSTYYR